MQIGRVLCSSGSRNKAMLSTKTMLDGREGGTVIKQASQNGLMKTVRALLQNCHRFVVLTPGIGRSLKAPGDIRGSVLAAAAGRVVGAVNRGNRGKENESDFPSKDVHNRNSPGRPRARAVHAAAVIHECLDDRVVRVICCAGGRTGCATCPFPLSLLPLPRAVHFRPPVRPR